MDEKRHQLGKTNVGDKEQSIFDGCVILAPMVRISKLPMRLLALDYGADFVFTEEIIDRRLIGCTVRRNESLQCTDFLEPDCTLILRIHDCEKSKLFVQLGTACAENAVKAAKTVEPFCFGVDVNMGCPKSFSVSGGMGAALLSKPAVAEEIMSSLVSNCLDLVVTCKIRLLPEKGTTPEKGIEFMQMLESCGVRAITVHGRYPTERPKNQVHLDLIREYASVVNVPVIANGLSGSREDLGAFTNLGLIKKETGCSAVMVARNAMWNCSIFQCFSKLKVGQFSPTDECSHDLKNYMLSEKITVAKELLKYCIVYNFPSQYFKYALLNSIGGDPFVDRVKNTTLMSEISAVFGLEDFYRSQSVASETNTSAQIGDNVEAKRLKLTPDCSGRRTVSFSFHFEYSKYRKMLPVPPKTVLQELMFEKIPGAIKAKFVTEPFQDSRWKAVCVLGKHSFESSHCERNKKHAEQVRSY